MKTKLLHFAPFLSGRLMITILPSSIGSSLNFSANFVTMLIPVGGGQYESLETKKLVEQFSGPLMDPYGPRPFPYMVRQA